MIRQAVLVTTCTPSSDGEESRVTDRAGHSRRTGPVVTRPMKAMIGLRERQKESAACDKNLEGSVSKVICGRETCGHQTDQNPSKN